MRTRYSYSHAGIIIPIMVKARYTRHNAAGGHGGAEFIEFRY